MYCVVVVVVVFIARLYKANCRCYLITCKLNCTTKIMLHNKLDAFNLIISACDFHN
jgi:hypothetical protein